MTLGTLHACERCPDLAERRRDTLTLPAAGVRPPFDVRPEVRVLVVGDNPTDEEGVLGWANFDAGDWITVRDGLVAGGLIPDDEAAITFAVRCPAGTQKKHLARKEIDLCRPWLHEEAALYPNLRVIVCLGRLAASSVLSVPLTKIASLRGKANQVVLSGREIPVIMSVHPYQATISPFDGEALRFDLVRAARMSGEGYRAFDMAAFQAEHADVYRLVDSPERAREMVDRLLKEPMVSFDTETRGLDPWHLPKGDELPGEAQADFLTSVQFSPGPDEAYFVPLMHKEHRAHSDVYVELARFFAEYQGFLTAYNAKFDQVAVGQILGVLPRVSFDAMIVDQLRRGMPARSLKKLAWEVSPFGGYEEEMNSAGGEHEHDSYFYPLDTLFWYGCLDVDVTWRAAEALLPFLEVEPKLASLSSFLAEASEALAEIELNGWRIDPEYLEAYGCEKTDQMKTAVVEMRASAPTEIAQMEVETEKPFNPSSTKDLADLLYGKLNLRVAGRTPKGEPSTAKAALKEIAGAHPIVGHVLELRKAEKAYNAFYKRWKEGVAADGRLHFRYNLVKFRDEETGDGGGTSTGRLSSSGAAGNVQQIPKDKTIRRVFLPEDPDSVILDVDFTTLEYVIAAIYSRDPKLCEAFQKGYDIHAAVAAEMFGGTAEEMAREENKKLRQKGKTLNFSLLFQAGPDNVAEQLGCSVDEAKAFMTQYKEQFPVLFQWVEGVKQAAKRTGCAESKFGRIRYLPDAKLPGNTLANKSRRGDALRQAVNSPVQGDASDVCLWGLVSLRRRLRENGRRAEVKATIHDALVLSVPIDELTEVYGDVVEVLTKPGLDWLDGPSGPGVPLRVSVEVGPNWGELERVG